ncbi:MAG: hypothetical protein N2255_06550 [Kiritimatiellae bacterium]|nr:hypothetical protein [Kiritimatiellia bacterium]
MYVDEKEACTVRVSLGLKPRFERTLAWTPYKRISAANLPVIRSFPEGVLVYEGQIYDMVRLYDHEGNYVRTVYPFPSDKVRTIEDLHWYIFPQDGARLPLKEWFRQATLLTSGENSNHPFRGFGEQRFAHDGHGAGAPHRAVSAMAIQGSRIALAMLYLNRLTLDGSAGGMKLNGPAVYFETQRGGYYASEAREIVKVYPTSAAMSPDGKWVYLTGYMWEASFGTGGRKNFWLHGVVRVPFEGEGEPTVFAGVMKDKGGDGTDNAHFRVPTCVACDGKGRVYVGDYMNDRIQVFAPDGMYLTTIPVRKPVHVTIDPKTGTIGVFSWLLGTWWLQESKETVPAKFVKLGTLENHGKPKEYELPLIRYSPQAGPWLSGLHYTAEFDPWAAAPTIWIYPGSYELTSFDGYVGEYRGRPYWQPSGIQLYTIEGDNLVLKRDFGREAADAVKKANRVAGTNRQVWVNPKSGRLWVGDGSANGGLSWSLVSEIDPETGEIRLVQLPFDTEQLAFDLDGHVYLRAHGTVVRYDPVDWREVRWDYGEEREAVSTANTQNAGPGYRMARDIAACLVAPFWEHAPNGVFNISARGHLVLPIKGRSPAETGVVFRKRADTKVADTPQYNWQLYPGRSTGGLVFIFDQRGQVVYEDAIPGLTFTHGIKIDRDDNLYALVMATRMLDGQPYFNPATCTLIKCKPRAARVRGTHPKCIPVPLTAATRPRRPPDIISGGKPGLGLGWVEGALWFYGGVGYDGEHHRNPEYGCDCCFSSFDLDFFGRSFAPEVEHCSVAVLDSEGNLITRIGTYGNVEDGMPLVKEGGPAHCRSIGGDEVALFYAPHVATHTDRRLFIADVGNERIVSVRLGYSTEKRIRLSEVGPWFSKQESVVGP